MGDCVQFRRTNAPLQEASLGDSLGWRQKFAVLVPSTNTSVQPEFDAMRPAGGAIVS